MELDTGAAVTFVSELTFQRKWSNVTLQTSTARLHTYSGEPLPVVGQAEVQVQYGEQELKLPLIVVGGKGPSLFGRDWLSRIQLDWKKIHTIQGSTLTDVLERHARVFQQRLGKVFTKFDLKQAYQQAPLTEESRKYVVVNGSPLECPQLREYSSARWMDSLRAFLV